MKKVFVLLLMVLSLVSFAQTKKDGTPDMRFKANKEIYGDSGTKKGSSFGDANIQYQDGYIKSNGTYVEPYVKSKPNDTNKDNFSAKGNVNPFTGSEGTKAKDYSDDASKYGGGKPIYTGEKGGQYYINDKGNKVYVPKRY